MEKNIISDSIRPDQTKAHVRNSSLELLRIIAVLMIIASHLSQHGGFEFQRESITLNRLWQQFLFLGGQRGNDMFILISGYFLVSSQKIKLSRLLRVVLPFALYGLLISALISYSGSEVFSAALLQKTLDYWWFIWIYIVLYMLHPYLNMFLNRLSQEEYKTYLKAVFIYWCIIPTLTMWNFGGSPLIDFVCVYSVGGYFRLWGNNSGGRKFIMYGIAFMLADWLILLLIDIIGLKYEVVAENALYFCGMMKPCTIGAAVCFFLGFRKLNMPHSRIINILAGASLGVYMLHENKFSQNLFWHEIFSTSSFTNSPYLIPYTLAVVIAVYVLCTLIELIRSGIFRVLSRGNLS